VTTDFCTLKTWLAVFCKIFTVSIWVLGCFWTTACWILVLPFTYGIAAANILVRVVLVRFEFIRQFTHISTHTQWWYKLIY
jgi:hypothetical protein